MCVVSMVSDHYRETRPLPNFWTMEQWQEYQELKRKATQYDERNKEPHCEKGDLIQWEKSILDGLHAKYANPLTGLLSASRSNISPSSIV